jgi:hypothetical protein
LFSGTHARIIFAQSDSVASTIPSKSTVDLTGNVPLVGDDWVGKKPGSLGLSSPNASSKNDNKTKTKSPRNTSGLPEKKNEKGPENKKLKR